jgi:enterochelin esterase-like enzyme
MSIDYPSSTQIGGPAELVAGAVVGGTAAAVAGLPLLGVGALAALSAVVVNKISGQNREVEKIVSDESEELERELDAIQLTADQKTKVHAAVKKIRDKELQLLSEKQAEETEMLRKEFAEQDEEMQQMVRTYGDTAEACSNGLTHINESLSKVEARLGSTAQQ